MSMYKISNKREKQGQKGMYVSATLTDEQGVEFAGINAFNGEFNVSDTWFGELVKNGNYYNLVSPKQSAGNNFKTATIEKAMDKKAQNIAQAQDRSAWMWAKTNASTLLAGSMNSINGTLDNQLIASKVIHLATLIYNGEPFEPFTSPKTHKTSPSEDFPEGLDMYNHPLTTDAERAEMDSLDNMR